MGVEQWQTASYSADKVATTVMPDPIPVVALGITPLVVVQDLFVQLGCLFPLERWAPWAEYTRDTW